jgi:hypothetical protein
MFVDRGIIAEMSLLSPSGESKYPIQLSQCLNQPIAFKTLENAFSECQTISNTELLQFF